MAIGEGSGWAGWEMCGLLERSLPEFVGFFGGCFQNFNFRLPPGSFSLPYTAMVLLMLTQ
jgi:hypothetical protein